LSLWVFEIKKPGKGSMVSCLIDSPATRYIGKAGNDDTEDSDLSTNWVESKTTNELREDQLISIQIR
jgi:hypothetical protein